MSSTSVETTGARLVRVRGRSYRDLSSASSASDGRATREEARERAKRTASESRGWRQDEDFRRADDDDDDDGGCARETVDDADDADDDGPR
jgi:hypothetical protein